MLFTINYKQMRTVEELNGLFREKGFKVTPQRQLIFQALQGNRTHPTAESVYRRVSAIVPAISLTTIYKTLGDLVALGELQELDVGLGRSHYDPDTTSHDHLVCLRCHSLFDSPAPGSRPSPPRELAEAGFQVVAQRTTFLGYCARCREDVDPKEPERHR